MMIIKNFSLLCLITFFSNQTMALTLTETYSDDFKTVYKVTDISDASYSVEITENLTPCNHSIEVNKVSSNPDVFFYESLELDILEACDAEVVSKTISFDINNSILIVPWGVTTSIIE